MTEKVAIANMALSWLGEEEITSLEDDLERARQIRINYIPARDATLEAHEWSFAMKRFIPGLLEETPVWGAVNMFSIPSDILRVTGVWADTGVSTGVPVSADLQLSREQADWVMEDEKILCPESAIYARGIRRVEEEGKFSPLFDHALAAKLASLVALSLTASQEIQGNMFNLYQLFIHEAKSRDGLQGRSRRIRNRRLLKSR